MNIHRSEIHDPYTIGGRDLFYLLASAWVMGDMIYRLIYGTRPFDWLMFGLDAAILIVTVGAIFLFTLPAWKHARKAQKFAAKVLPFLREGQRLYQATPDRHDEEAIMGWVEKAKDWEVTTGAFLAQQSERASFAFELVVNAYSTDRILSGYAGDIYQRFQVKLDTLARIVERPDSYC